MNFLPLRHAVPLLAMLCAVPVAQACGPLPAPGTQAPAAHLQQLQTLEPRCLHSAAYYRSLAQAWLATGQAPLALEAWERALLLEPDHPGTQLDYAQTLLTLGDTQSAQHLLQQLQARPDLPAHLQPLLQQQLAQLQAQQQAGPWAQRLTASGAVVADSNLNNAPASNSLTLTLPQGNVNMPLANSYQRQGGVAQQLQAQWVALRPVGPQLWVLQAEARQRHHAQAAHRYTHADASATWLQAPDAPQQWLARASASTLYWGGQHLYRSLRGGVQHQWQLPGSCRWALGADWEGRQYPHATSLNGQYSGLNTSWHCQTPGQQWQVQLRAGQDVGNQATRPGGHYQQQELRLAWQKRWGQQQLVADYQLALQQDSTGYSPLLQANAPRQQQRHALGLEWSAPVAAGSAWQWYTSLEVSRQHSNLGPFATARNALGVGLRWATP